MAATTDQQQGRRYETWQEYEVAIGCTQTVYPSSIGRQRMTAKWDPFKQWDGSDRKDSYRARYGYYNQGAPGDMQLSQESQLYSAGNYAGENAAGAENSPEVLAAARQLTNNPQLTLSAQDVQDMRVVADPGGGPAERRSKFNEVVPLFVSRVLPLISGEKGGEVVQPGEGKAAGGAVVAGPAGQTPGTAEILAAAARVERAADRLELAAARASSTTTLSPTSTPSDPRVTNAAQVLEQAVKASGAGGGAPLKALRDAVSRATSILRAG